MDDLSPAKVSKAREAIDFLSSLSVAQNEQSRAGPSRTERNEGIAKAADKAIESLRRMQAGIKADATISKKKMKKEMSHLFNPKKRKIEKRVAWRHKFVCLAYRDQQRIPTTDADKEELYQAGLGEKEICFDNLDMPQEEFREHLLEQFPRLRDGGGFQLLKGSPNSRSTEVLSVAVHNSPSLLKQRVGSSRTYIRPLQRDLDLTPTEDTEEAPMEKCLTCELEYPLDELPQHVVECEKALKELKNAKPRPKIATTTASTSATADATVTVDLTNEPGDECDVGTFDDDLPRMEEELFQRAVEQSLADAPPKLLHENSSLKDVIIIVEGNPTILEIRRSHIVKDSMKEARKMKFQPTRHVKVRFVGEGGVDHGGPRREFFRLLALAAKDVFFEGLPTAKFFGLNVPAIQAKDLYNLGRFVGMAIIQGGSGLPFLAEPVYNYFVTGECTGIVLNTEDIADPTVRFAVEKVDNAESDNDMVMVFTIDEMACLLLETGYRKAVSRLTISDKAAVRSTMVDYYCMLKVKAAMDQFAQGLQELNILEYMKKYPKIMKPLFVDNG